ncbi:hypothetical protein HY417_00670 [Candidatus Kaiserbacteria bacterium]|nr:hypothetical protein [Candidatus Kaiserbacteria bacterium]
MAKYIVGAIALVLIILAGYYAWQYESTPVTPPPPPPPPSSTYATSTFSIAYPSSFLLDDTYAYDQFEGKPVAGVQFMIPISMTEGTNLSSDTYLSVEWLPRAKQCTGDIFIVPNVKPFEFAVGSTTYSVATTTGAAAGNIYEEQVFAVEGSKPCTAVRYFIHSGNIGNYPSEGEGAVTEFNRATLFREFDSIRDALVLSP